MFTHDHFYPTNKILLKDGKMKTKKEKPEKKKGKKKNGKELPGYPVYPPSEDIYNKAIEETELDPDDLTQKKAPNEAPDLPNEKNFGQDKSASDLDIPGAELDDTQEDIGSEDEENNYYSIGGDKD